MNSQRLAFLFAIFFSNSAFALGLGEITVQSHLGQPLRASIRVLDAPKDLQTECFSLQSSHDASRPNAASARITLKTRRDETTLFITTAQSINDPVFQITVSATCADHLQREYMLLLDPPLAHEPVAAAAESLTPYAEPSPMPRKQARHSGRNTSTRIYTTKLASRSPKLGAQTTPDSTQRALQKPVAAKLVLSGGRYRPDTSPTTAVTMSPDMVKRDSLRPSSQAALNPTELSDEQTSLEHRIVYLHGQLTALKKRNDELDAAASRAVKVSAPPPLPKVIHMPKEKALSPWSRFLIGLGLLLGGMALFLGWRAYSRSKIVGTRLAQESAFPAVTALGDSALEISATPPAQPLHPPAPESEPGDSAIFSQALSTYGTEVNEDILDQAEVYMAHGHASLAIHLLQEHLCSAPTESPVPWLLLLDLLTREGLEADYLETCKACKKHYNINLSASPAVVPTSSAHLEAYPHVIAQLQTVWPTRETIAFLAELVHDHRGGIRLGFDPGAYREILLLRSIAEVAVYDEPQDPPKLLGWVHSIPPENDSIPDTTEPVSLKPMADLDTVDTCSQSPSLVCTVIGEDILDTVEAAVAQGQSELTIPLLRQRLRETPTVSPVPWLQLLDLLALAGFEAEYQAARSECQNLFNVNLSARPTATDSPGRACLEAYPHVVGQLQSVWNTPEAEDFVSNLVYDQRGGIRQGFDLGAYGEILLLHSLAAEYTYPDGVLVSTFEH